MNALEARGVHFRSLTDGIDTKTPAAGRFFFHIMASLAQLERDLIVERTRQVLPQPANSAASSVASAA